MLNFDPDPERMDSEPKGADSESELVWKRGPDTGINNTASAYLALDPGVIFC